MNDAVRGLGRRLVALGLGARRRCGGLPGPSIAIWGQRNVDCHAALQAMWAQYDHVLPHAYGGGNDLDNLVVTCAPCNFGRMEYTLEDAGLIDPRTRPPVRSSWDGLEQLMRAR